MSHISKTKEDQMRKWYAGFLQNSTSRRGMIWHGFKGVKDLTLSELVDAVMVYEEITSQRIFEILIEYRTNKAAHEMLEGK